MYRLVKGHNFCIIPISFQATFLCILGTAFFLFRFEYYFYYFIISFFLLFDNFGRPVKWFIFRHTKNNCVHIAIERYYGCLVMIQFSFWGCAKYIFWDNNFLFVFSISFLYMDSSRFFHLLGNKVLMHWKWSIFY